MTPGAPPGHKATAAPPVPAWMRPSSGRHKWRPYVCGEKCSGRRPHAWRLNAAGYGARCRGRNVALARRGAIHDARCPAGAQGNRRPACFRVDAPVVRASQVAPLRLAAKAAGYGVRHGMATGPVAVTENSVVATDETGTAPATDGTDGKILCVNRNEKE